MTTLVHEIANRLATYGALTTPPASGLGFVILERWPVRPSGDPQNPIKGETPEAFDETRGRKMKRTIAVMDQGEVPNPASQPFDVRRWDSFPLLYCFAETTANGKEAIQSAYLYVERLLVGWEAVVAGQRVGFLPDNRIGWDDSDEFPESVVQVWRFRATGVRRIVPIP